ncbi:MAG: family 1 glycosylhydrolase [Sphingomicrobium sp.]|nr:sugar nucleotide-binding protein [Sphingomonadales bacterium]
MRPLTMSDGDRSGALELWGGVECTVVRIGDRFRDQLADTGHRDRLGDIDLLAPLGLKAIRYPIVWETVAPEDPERCDFSWHDERLTKIRALGIRPIVTLVHHGSGPRYTSLLDPDFPRLLADYARRVAERFPWIEDWTPVNEPLTTARFSCLYGHWYPHQRNLGATFQALINECLGTIDAMQAVREINPRARLVVTEDLGKTFATAPLARQAEHENHRRWLSLDLLTGRVVAGHPLYARLIGEGCDPDALARLATAEGGPDLIGINHYLTSERYLDHRIGLYPDVAPGTNGRQTYVDLEAVRVPQLAGEVGPGPRLREAWERYGLPMVVSEVHHGCTREEQVRWFRDVWQAAEAERRRGADIRAVTLWSMFGTVDWRSLLTRFDHHYEGGAFDTRSPEPRRTLVADVAAALGRAERPDHPVLDQPGWWQRPGRFYGAQLDPAEERLPGRKLLITGATGTLGQAFARICHHRGIAYRLTTRAELDITDPTSIAAALSREQPWAVINAAGFVRTWDADAMIDECFSINALGAEQLARSCRVAGIPFVTFSSDLVFDGQLGRPYVEVDSVSPQGAYGRSKAQAEQRVLATYQDALVVRTSAFFGPWDRHNFLVNIIGRLKRGEHIDDVGDDAIVSPTYVPDLVHATLDLLLDRQTGIHHLANQGEVSWHDLARDIATRTGNDPRRILPATTATPSNTSLGSGHGTLLRPLSAALDDFVRHSRPLAELA